MPLPPILQKAAQCTLLAAAPGKPPPVFILSLDRAVAFDRLCTNTVKGYRGVCTLGLGLPMAIGLGAGVRDDMPSIDRPNPAIA